MGGISGIGGGPGGTPAIESDPLPTTTPETQPHSTQAAPQGDLFEDGAKVLLTEALSPAAGLFGVQKRDVARGVDSFFEG